VWPMAGRDRKRLARAEAAPARARRAIGCARPAPSSWDQPRLAAAALEIRQVFHIQQRHRIFWVLQIGSPIIRSPTGHALDAGILSDRFIELHHDRPD